MIVKNAPMTLISDGESLIISMDGLDEDTMDIVAEEFFLTEIFRHVDPLGKLRIKLGIKLSGPVTTFINSDLVDILEMKQYTVRDLLRLMNRKLDGREK